MYRNQPADLVAFLAGMSDCPENIPEAEKWIDAHAEVAVFDPATRRYVIPETTSGAQ